MSRRQNNMRKYVSPILAAGLCLGMAGVAQAQDFEGAYAGAHGRLNFNGPWVPGDAAVGAFAGYNMGMGNGLILGVEGEVEYDFNSAWSGGANDLMATANLRAGADAGGALIYGKAGVGYSSAGTGTWNVGAGADVPITDGYFVRGEVERVDPFVAGLSTRHNVKAGVGLKF